MPKIPANLTGAAGEHFVVYQLSCLGYVAALPRAGAMGVDILVSNTQGSESLAIQVKTTDSAVRTRGRGKNKQPYELQFPLGSKSAKLSSRNLFFAFVDLRHLENLPEQPDVYIIPSQVVHDWCESWVDRVPMVRLHKLISDMAPYKNQWSAITSRLDP